MGNFIPQKEINEIVLIDVENVGTNILMKNIEYLE